jgi:hypothetical protein
VRKAKRHGFSLTRSIRLESPLFQGGVSQILDFKNKILEKPLFLLEVQAIGFKAQRNASSEDETFTVKGLVTVRPSRLQLNSLRKVGVSALVEKDVLGYVVDADYRLHAILRQEICVEVEVEVDLCILDV